MADRKANKRASKEQMDERVKLDLPADTAIKAILETGPHPAEEDKDDRT